MTYDRQLKNYSDLNYYLEKEGDVACQQIPDIFFPEDFADRTLRKRSIELAKNLCAECPIRMQCLEVALANREGYGIWGGLTPEERGYVGR